VHHTAIQSDDLRALEVGDKVKLEIKKDAKGSQAINVTKY
jgi:cold shock CspA family protein